MDQENNNSDAVNPHEEITDERDTQIKADIISVDTLAMKGPEIEIDDTKVSSTQHLDLHDTVKHAGLLSTEDKCNEDMLTVHKDKKKEEAMEIDDVKDLKDDTIISRLSDEVLRLNPDFAAFSDLGCSRGLRRREKKVIKNEPKIIEKPKERRKKKERKKSKPPAGQSKSGLKVHNSTNKKGLIACESCSKTFQSKSGLQKHMLTLLHYRNNMQDLVNLFDKPDPINYKCALCKQLFETNNELLSHKKETHSNVDPFMCKCCKVAFSDHYDYLIHNMIHINPRDIPIPCPECPKTFNTKTGYQMHIGLHFKNKFECDVCMRNYGNERNLILHKKQVHDGIKDNKVCPECNKVTRVLKYHMLTHTGVRPYQCLYCGMGFRTSQARRNHTRIHTDEKPFECETCHRKFRQATTLQSHKENHNKERSLYICEYCDKKFKNESYMKQHQRRHTNTGLFKCPECEQTSTSRPNLRKHIIHKHTTERLHRCDICNVGFKTKWELKQHSQKRRHRNNAFGFMKKKGELKNDK